MEDINDNGQFKNWDCFIYDGDLNALSRVYFYYYDQLFTYGLKHVDDKPLVEDAIQNVFLNLIKSRKSIGRVRNLTGYLVSTFRRQLFFDLHKQKRTILSEELSEGQFDYFKSPEQDVSEKEKQEQLHLIVEQCIGKLTARQQESLFLRFENEVSYEEISRMLNISVDSCYKLVYRTVKMIRQEAEKIVGEGENLIFWFSLVMRSKKYKSQQIRPIDKQ